MSNRNNFVYLQKTEGNSNFKKLSKGLVAKSLGALSPQNRNEYVALKTQKNLLQRVHNLNRTKRRLNLNALREAALVSKSRPGSPTPRRTRRTRRTGKV